MINDFIARFLQDDNHIGIVLATYAMKLIICSEKASKKFIKGPSSAYHWILWKIIESEECLDTTIVQTEKNELVIIHGTIQSHRIFWEWLLIEADKEF